jgi:hypothetical protein
VLDRALNLPPYAGIKPIFLACRSGHLQSIVQDRKSLFEKHPYGKVRVSVEAAGPVKAD